jgi:hypothetical protein
MAALTIQNVVLGTSLTPSFAAAEVGGDTFVNNGNTFLYAKNGSGGDITVTVDSLQACDQGHDHNDATVVPAGSEEMIGPFPVHRFNSAAGSASITYSGVTSLTIAAIKLG